MRNSRPPTPERGSAATPHVTVLTDRCAGCQDCAVRCPAGALAFDPVRLVTVADDRLCVGCRQCERTCAFAAITVDGPRLVAGRLAPEPPCPDVLPGDTSEVAAGFASWDQALAEASRCLDCPDPTCVRGCPGHNDIPAFVAALRAHDLAGAHEVLRRTSVLPDVCSRVCDQEAQCEGACTWALAGGEPVAIGKLERFVTDHAPVPPPARRRHGPGRGLRVAVVGAGPAGIGAAWTLTENGAAVTVYEDSPQPGGVLAWGIPDFILPREVAARPWDQLTAAGVDLRCGVNIRPEDLGELRADYDAVILACGATVPLWPAVPGADLAGVTDATSFLTSAKRALAFGGVGRLLAAAGMRPAAGQDVASRVLVFGAGDTALDVARTARRLGLRAVCAARRTERLARARPGEVARARAEGVEFRFGHTLTLIEGEHGRVRQAVLARTRPRRSGRPPRPVRRGVERMDVDLVVMALGYRPDPGLAGLLAGPPAEGPPAAGIPDRRWQASGILSDRARAYAHNEPVGRLALRRETGLAASAVPLRDGFWVAGDALTGPSTVAEAMAQGRRAAAAVIASA